MGKKAAEIAELDVKELIRDLNGAMADEELAAYWYWLAAKTVEGKQAPVVARLLEESVEQEREHADELATRILQLGGKPLADPNQWKERSNCGYMTLPEDSTDLDFVIRQVVDAEACAIDVYNRLAKKTLHKDPVTYQLVTHILAEEVEHEEKFQTLLGKAR
ncbi:MAG: ferritin-like domain-containing protein [Candidatus Geothermarchaeales archaeon]